MPRRTALLGTVVGLLVRRTLPAMAITLVVFAAVQVLMGTTIRAHLMTPVATSVTLNSAAMQRINGLTLDEEGVSVIGYSYPGAWTLTDRAALLKADGSRFTKEDNKPCITGDFDSDAACLAGKNLHFGIKHQPADRSGRSSGSSCRRSWC